MIVRGGSCVVVGAGIVRVNVGVSVGILVGRLGRVGKESAWPVALSAGTGDSGRVRKRN